MIPNDADLEMNEMRQIGDDLARGVCPICDDVLDPLTWPIDRHFDQETDQYGRPLPERSVHRLSRQEYARLVGPANGIVEGYHNWCLESRVQEFLDGEMEEM